LDRLRREPPSRPPRLGAMAGEMSEPALSINMRLERSPRQGPKFVLDVALDFSTGPTVIFGPSGAGKSTLLDCIAGLVKPQRGKITVEGETLFDANTRVDTRP